MTKRTLLIPLLLPALTLCAQGTRPAPKAAKPAAKAGKAAPKATPKAAPKEGPEAHAIRQSLQDTLDAVDAAWFGKTYTGYNAVDIQGSLGVTLSAAALNAKVAENTGGQVKGGFAKGGSANLTLKGTYFANGDFLTELRGDFGNMLYTRVGNRGYLYSKEQNAYTTRIDPPPSDPVLTYQAWFRSLLNDIKAVYIDAPSFRASAGKEDERTRTLVFNAPTGAYDAKKREQGISDSLGFWKRGRLEITVDKGTKLPQHLLFSNDQQGVRTRMDFTYAAGGRLAAVAVTNQSRGMEGPGSLQIQYGADGLMTHIAGMLASEKAKITFSWGLNWTKGRKAAYAPPPTTNKKGREELETSLLVTLAGQLAQLQHAGLNLRSVSLSGK